MQRDINTPGARETLNGKINFSKPIKPKIRQLHQFTEASFVNPTADNKGDAFHFGS
jgi:hypothetical protein